MQVTKIFPRHDPGRHSRPWFARIAGWPDTGPAILAFGKTVKGASPPACTVEAEAGDVVRWGMKDLTTGTADPAEMGWAIVAPGGALHECSQDEARAARRRRHPDDAKLPAVGFAPAKGRGGRRRAAVVAPAPTPTPAASAHLGAVQEAHHRALMDAARRVSARWRAWRPSPTIAADAGTGWEPLVDAILALMDLAPAEATPVVAPTPEPEAVDVGADEDVDEAPPAPPPPPPGLPVDENGMPLF